MIRLALVTLVSTIAGPAVAGCIAAAPADLGPGRTTWIGACSHGHADGPGVLRAPRPGGLRLFYGRMAAGRPTTGVIATAAGDYIPAWRFDAALKPVDDPSGNRQSSVATFDTAAAGAKAASVKFDATGNHASAKLYAKAADDLAKALD